MDRALLDNILQSSDKAHLKTAVFENFQQQTRLHAETILEVEFPQKLAHLSWILEVRGSMAVDCGRSTVSSPSLALGCYRFCTLLLSMGRRRISCFTIHLTAYTSSTIHCGSWRERMALKSLEWRRGDVRLHPMAASFEMRPGKRSCTPTMFPCMR